MAGKTVSAYADQDTARRVAHAARVAARPVSQIASAALAFYARLPGEAHDALRRIEALGGPGALDRVARAVARQIIDAEHDLAEYRAATAIPDAVLTALGTLDSEADILATAARLAGSVATSGRPDASGGERQRRGAPVPAQPTAVGSGVRAGSAAARSAPRRRSRR